MDIWDILFPFGTFCVHLVHYFRFWYHAPKKSGDHGAWPVLFKRKEACMKKTATFEAKLRHG
jgi:hypothetical protein